ncbi:MAG: hypothetical protein EOM25_09355 [Deltaproteobacteria bacterium]|nr:hypothetical protein [Deltaproteobacteria bacterium]
MTETSIDVSTIKRAWREMFRTRTCPPHSILMDESQAEKVREHARGCVFCAMEKKMEPDWHELGSTLAGLWPPPLRPEPGPGQVWALKERKGGWDECFRHINPPLVVVLKVMTEDRAVRVAQTFDEGGLAGDGDVPLGPGLPWAESWNTYALDVEDLDFCLGRAEPERVGTVLRNCDQESSSIDQDSPVWFFRQLELDIGSRMALEALDRLVDRHERASIVRKLGNESNVRSRVLAFDSRIGMPKTGDVLQSLAQTELPRDRLPLAAAGEAEHSFIVFRPENEKTLIEAGLAILHRLEWRENTIHCTAALNPEAAEGQVFAWWKHGQEMTEGNIFPDPLGGPMVRAEFPDLSEEAFSSGRPVVLLVIDGHDRH